MKKSGQKWLVSVVLAILGGSANSDSVIDGGPLIGDYVASTPGLEIAVPKRTRAEGGFNFHFDVLKLGTQTKLFSTTDKYLPYYPGCVDGDTADNGYLYQRLGSSLIMQFRSDSSCPSTKKSGWVNIVYGVDLSAIGKTPWTKTMVGKPYATGLLPDMNKNGVGELSITIETGQGVDWGSGNGNIDNAVYVYDGLTGVQLATPQKYAIER